MTFELVQLDDYRVSKEDEIANLRTCCTRIDQNLALIELGLLDMDAVQQATLRDVHLARIKELENTQ